jgi:hypothetical protein
MTQLATTAPADTDRTAEIAALNDAARAGSLVTSKPCSRGRSRIFSPARIPIRALDSSI